MVTLKTTGRVDRSRTLAVTVPECGIAAGEYEVLVVLDGNDEAAHPAPKPDYRAWLSGATGSARAGVTTDSILSESRGED